ncbi:MAG: hypothetical protein RJA18_1419, partial [Pseudomonadota bacterium]
DNPDAHDWFEKFWNTPLDKKPGYTIVEILHKITAPDSDPDKIRGMYIMGENPAMSDPDLNHARHALASLDHLVVQDIFMTETAWLADVILPASAWPEKTGTVTNTDRKSWQNELTCSGAIKAKSAELQRSMMRCAVLCMPPFRGLRGSVYSVSLR